MSWNKIKKRNEEKESNNSNVVKAINNATGGFWKQVGQNAVASQKRKEEQERAKKKQSSKQTNMPSTYKRTIQPSATQQNQFNLVNPSELKGEKLEKVYNNNTTWGQTMNFLKNIGRAVDNLKNGAIKGTIGAGQSVTRNVGDIQDFANSSSKSITEKIFGKSQFSGTALDPMFVVDKQQEKIKEDRNIGLDTMQNIRNKYNEKIQGNIQNAKLTEDSVGKFLTEITPSMGQQVPAYILNHFMPGSSLFYFQASSEADYYDDAKARGMSEEQSKLYSKLMSFVEMGTEELELSNVMKTGKITKGALSATKKSGIKEGLKAGVNIFKETAKEETVQNMTNAFKSLGITGVENAIQEGVTEPLQEFTAMAVAGKDKANWDGIWDRIWDSAVKGGVTGSIMSGASMGFSACQVVVDKINKGQTPSTQEYKKAIKECTESKDIDVVKSITNDISNKVNEIKQIKDDSIEETTSQALNTDNQVINQETKTSQNQISQAPDATEALRQEARSKLESIKQNYDENSYNQMQEFIETAPNEKALNQVINDLNKESERTPIKTENKSFEDVAFEAMNNYEDTTPQSPMQDRNIDTIGKETNKNAYQYDNPKVKPYFQDMARQMREDLAYISSPENRSTKKGGGTKLNTNTKAIDILHNEQGYSYFQIAKGLQNIMEDNGKENNAISKKLELLIDEQLREGYNNAFGKYVEPNQDYINTIQENKAVQLPTKQEKPNIINKKVNEYIDSVKDNFKSDINIKTQSINEGDVAPLDYNKAGQSVLAKKAQNLVDRLKTRVFKNNNEDIHVSNGDIRKSISETLKNPEQNKYKKENVAVFSQLDKVIENAKLLDVADEHKGRDYYSDYKYYVSNVYLDGNPFVVEFDTRMQDSGNGTMERHFRLERVYPLNNNEVVSNTVPKVNSDNTFLNETTSINNSISQNERNVKSDSTNINNMQNNQENMQQFSMQEQQKQNNFEYKESKNSKVDTFRQDASKYWDNSEKTTKLVNTIEKIINDKGYNIRLDDTLGDNVNGRIRTNQETGETEITINPNSSRKGEFIIGHELTHAIQTQKMIDLVNERMKKDGELRNAVEDLKKLYGTDDINAEVLADISGQLFGNQEFINNLSVEKPNVFKRIYDKIVSLANKITGNSSEALFIKDLKNKWEKAYRENTNKITNAEYSLNKDGNFEVDKIPSKLYDKIIKDLNSLKNISTDYFEAKPQRAVGFDEIDAIILPKNASKELKQQLKDRGIKTIEYDSNNENERADILKSLNEYKFSKTSQSWQDYLEKNYKSEGTTTDLRDIRLPIKEKQEVKAPIKQEQTSAKNAQVQNNNTKGETINWNEIERPENNQKFRKHYRSIIESNQTTAEAKSIAKELMGTDTYTPDSNENELLRADNLITEYGVDAMLNSIAVKANSSTEKVTSTDIAVGNRLIQYYSKIGDAKNLREAIMDTAMMGTNAGQTVQAMAIIKRMSPQGQAYYLQKEVDKANKDLARKKGGTIIKDENGNIEKVVSKNGKDITNKVQLFELTDEMLSRIATADKSNLENVLDSVYEELGKQVPLSKMEQLDEWRYFSMLANVRTHARNSIGNVIMHGMQYGVKDRIGAIGENIASKFNPEMERTKTNKKIDQKTKNFARNDLKDEGVQVRLGLGEDKYNTKSRLQKSRKMFKNDKLNKTLGFLYEKNSQALEFEDALGLEAGYKKALARYIVANNINVENITSTQLEKARAYAIQSAQEATFHQANAIATWLQQLGNKSKVAKIATDALVPFKKTPMNIAKTGFEYSPAQLAKSLTYDIYALNKGNITVNQYIDNLSKGLTGSLIASLGMALAKAGVIKAGGDDDKDKENYEQQQGKQQYSMTIAGKNISLDWLAPSAMPLFVGAKIQDLLDKKEEEEDSTSDNSVIEKGVKKLAGIVNAISTVSDPMNEMSMISGLTSTLQSYNSSNSSGAISDMLTSAGKSYLGQYIPTILGQFAKTTDEYERSTKSTKTGTVEKAVDQLWNQTKAKVPGLRQTLPIKTDIWGKDLKQEASLPLRAFNNFINPATVKEVSTDKVDKELNKLYEVNKNSSLLPDILTKTVQLNKQTYRLSNKEYAEVTKKYGQTSHRLIESFIKTSDYNRLTQEQKETAIADIYSYAKEQNKLDYAKKVNEEVKPSTLYTTMKAIEAGGGKQSEYLSYLAKTKGMSKESEKNKVLADSNYSNKTKEIIYTNGTGKDDNLYNNLLSKSDINMTEYLDYKDKVSNKAFSADKDKNGKTITGSAKKKVINYLNKNITGYGNRLLIAGKQYSLTDSQRKDLSNYINKTFTTQAERTEVYKQLKLNFVVNGNKVTYK